MQTAMKIEGHMTGKKKGDVSGYTVDPELSMTKRIAHFLDWAATHRPKEFQAFNVILQAIMGYKHLPRLTSEEVKFVQRASSRVRAEVLKAYKRGFVSQPGLGVRATVDDSDMVKFDLPKKGQRVQSAMNSFTASVNVVNPANIPKTPEMAPYMKYLRGTKEVVALFESNDFMQKLLPPKTGESK